MSLFKYILQLAFYHIYLKKNIWCTPVGKVVVWRCSVEKVFFEISQSSQENTLCQSLFFSKFLLKKRLWHMKFAKFLRTLFFTEHLRWLLLQLDLHNQQKGLQTFGKYQN